MNRVLITGAMSGIGLASTQLFRTRMASIYGR